jgi:O-antigen/teichoic acid export membrane protein
MSIDRDTFKHAAVYSFTAVLGRLIGFIMLPFYAHILRGIGYGIIGMSDTALSMLTSLVAYGVRGAMIRIYHEEEGENKIRVISTGILLMALVTAILVLPCMLLSRPLSNLLFGSSEYYLLLCLALGGFYLDLTSQAAGTLLIIQRRSVHFSTVSILRLVLGLSLNIYFIVILKMGLLGYFLATIITSLIPACIFYWIAYKQCGAAFDRRIARKLFHYQAPLVPGSLATFFSRQAERILVRFMMTIESVGVLEMGYRFPILLTLLIHTPFMRSWDTGRMQIGEEPDAPARIGRMFTYAFFLISAAGLVIAVCVEDVLHIMTPSEFWPAHRIAKFEVVTAILASATYHVNFGIFYRKVTKIWAYIRIATSIIKIGLSYLFIWLWGLYGAALSASVVAAITLVWAGIVGQSYYRIKIEYKKILGLVAAGGVIYFVLTHVDLQDIGFMRALSQKTVPGLIENLRGTFLGTWKSGAALRILHEKSDLVLDTTGKFLLCLLYLLFWPMVHDRSGRKLRRKLSSLRFGRSRLPGQDRTP